MYLSKYLLCKGQIQQVMSINTVFPASLSAMALSHYLPWNATDPSQKGSCIIVLINKILQMFLTLNITVYNSVTSLSGRCQTVYVGAKNETENGRGNCITGWSSLVMKEFYTHFIRSQILSYI